MRVVSFVAAAAVSLSFTTALAAEGVGEAMAVIDAASVSGQIGKRVLAVGSRVFIGDLVATDAAGEAQLLFADGTRMVVGPNSSLVIEEFLFRGKAAENRFAVRALGGAFRFISGDSGDKGYSIQTPTGTIGVRGTAFDFTVTPEGTKLVLLEGETTMCSEDGDEDDDCKTVATPCAVLRTDDDEPVEEVPPGEGRQEEIDQHFPYVASDSELRDDFQVAGHGCAGGGLSNAALNQSVITTGAVAAGAGALILGGVIILLSDDSSSSSSTNGTNK
jgi:hypothetical protein